jgi:hypothetical protein
VQRCVLWLGITLCIGMLVYPPQSWRGGNIFLLGHVKYKLQFTPEAGTGVRNGDLLQMAVVGLTRWVASVGRGEGLGEEYGLENGLALLSDICGRFRRVEACGAGNGTWPAVWTEARLSGKRAGTNRETWARFGCVGLGILTL